MQKNFALFIDTQKKPFRRHDERHVSSNKLNQEYILTILFLYLYDLEKLELQ